LVAVGAITRGGGGDDLSLREFARQRLIKRFSRVSRTCQAHRLIDERASGKRIANCAADAGRSPAEGFNLRGMIVRFVFKENEPFLLLTVDRDRGLDRTGIDLVGLVQFRQFTLFFEPLCTNGRHVHERHRLFNA